VSYWLPFHKAQAEPEMAVNQRCGFNDCGEWDHMGSYIGAGWMQTEVYWSDGPLLFNWDLKHFARWGIITGYLNMPLPVDQLRGLGGPPDI
jgi:hypothetical protein